MSKRRKLTPDEIRQLETMSGLRLPTHQIAAILGLSKTHLEVLIKKDDAARNAVEMGRAVASTTVRQRAYEQAIGGNTTMLIFWLKTQEGFRETDRLELSGPNGGPIESTRELTPEMRQKKIEKYKKLLESTEDE